MIMKVTTVILLMAILIDVGSLAVLAAQNMKTIRKNLGEFRSILVEVVLNAIAAVFFLVFLIKY